MGVFHIHLFVNFVNMTPTLLESCSHIAFHSDPQVMIDSRSSTKPARVRSIDPQVMIDSRSSTKPRRGRSTDQTRKGRSIDQTRKGEVYRPNLLKSAVTGKKSD